jgi:hypothetical protein
MDQEKPVIKPSNRQTKVGMDVGVNIPNELANCCKRTIDLLSKNNPMMVCQECKHMIKVFSSDIPFKNYVRFCNSRHRSIFTCSYKELKVVIYQAFNSFGR